MPDSNDFYAFKGMSGKGGNGNGKGFGCGWVVIVIVAIILISFIVNGAGLDAIDALLGLGLIAFFVARSLLR